MKTFSIVELEDLFFTVLEGTIYGYSSSNTKEDKARIFEANHALIKEAVMQQVNMWAKEAKDIVDINYIKLTEYTADLQIVKRIGKSQTFRIKASIIHNFNSDATSLVYRAITK